MSISNELSQSDIDDAVEANRAVLQEQFPDLDLSVGGPVDSLLVDGNAVITAQNNADVDKAYLYQQLKAISEGVVTVDDSDVDRLMANYFLERRASMPARGRVTFIVRDNITYTFQSGYTLRTADNSYRLQQTFTVYPTGTTGVDFTADSNIRLQQVYDSETGYNYRFELPIESVEASPTAVLTVGDRLTASQPFDALGYIEASTNFSGGVTAETNQEFAARGLEGLLSRTVGGQDNIRKLVRDEVQLSDSWARGVGDVTMTRDRNNVFGLSTGGKIDVYFKAGTIAHAGYSVDAVVVDDAARTAEITLTREQSAGVYRLDVAPLYTSSPPTIVSGDLIVGGVSHNAWTETDTFAFNPDMPDEYDRAFSARQRIVISITDDRQDSGGYVVDMSGGAGTTLSDSYSVSVEYQPHLLTIDSLLTDAEARPPGTDVLVKAAVPAIVTVGVNVSRPDDYNGPDADSIAQTLVSLINRLALSRRFLDTSTISVLLNQVNSDLTFNSAALSATIYGQNGTDYSLPSVGGRLTLPTIPDAKIEPLNTYFTTDFSRVTVTFV